MAAAALSLASLPPCLSCAGGGEINGLPCRECGGSSRAGKVQRRPWRDWLVSLADKASAPVGNAVGTALRWSMSLPGLAGAAGVSYGTAAVAHGLVGRIPEVPAAVLVAAVFCLALDRRMP